MIIIGLAGSPDESSVCLVWYLGSSKITFSKYLGIPHALNLIQNYEVTSLLNRNEVLRTPYLYLRWDFFFP